MCGVMQHRRSLRLAAGALVFAALPLLSSCGFDKATDLPYTPGVGPNNRDSEVDVLSAVIVADQANSGTFIATLANNSSETEHTFESISSSSEDEELTFADVDPAVEVAPRGYVNLADDDQGGVAVRGEFEAGDFVNISLSFTGGETVDMQIPVVFACDEYADRDTSLESTLAEPSSETAGLPAPGEPYDCASVLYDQDSGQDTEPEAPAP